MIWQVIKETIHYQIEKVNLLDFIDFQVKIIGIYKINNWEKKEEKVIILYNFWKTLEVVKDIQDFIVNCKVFEVYEVEKEADEISIEDV